VDSRSGAGFALGTRNRRKPGGGTGQEEGYIRFDPPGRPEKGRVRRHSGIFYHHIGFFKIFYIMAPQDIPDGKAPQLFQGRGQDRFIPQIRNR
jgi:hypothetical protein